MQNRRVPNRIVHGAGIAGIYALAFGFTPGLTQLAMAAEEDTSGLIEEIVVTSRRRQESQQDVPLSVTAFGAERIEQLKPTTLRDFDGLAPNVYIGMNTAGPSASAIYIRGIGYADIEKTQSPQVGVIVDGVQIGSSTGQLVDVFDVESIEVNRGPQGVLFGKNTIGGNIVVNRVRPQFNDWGFKASVEGGNYSSQTYKARVNIPLVDDKLSLKIGAIERERDGYYSNRTLGQSAGDVEFSSQTIALRWAPTDDIDAILTYDRISDESQIPPQDPRFDGSDPFVNLADKEEPIEYDVDQISLRLDWTINDRFTLHSITASNQADDLVNQDFDGASISSTANVFAQLHTLRDQEYEVFTQEIRLDGDINDNVDFMVGFYYFDSDLEFKQSTNNVLQLNLGLPAGVPCAAIGFRDNPTVGNALCQFPNARSVQLAGESVESTSFFAAVNFRPWEDWEFTIGARYIDEEKDADNFYLDYSDGTYDTGPTSQEHNFSALPVTGQSIPYAVSDSWDDTIFMASGRWDITEHNMAYFSYSEGFRSGGFSIRSAGNPSQAAFDPEDAFQVEVGIKNEFFDRHLQVNLAYFYLERDGGQFSSIITLPPGQIPGTTTIINNGDTTEIQGFELETQWLINENFTASLNGGIIDAENSAFTKPCEIIDGCGADPIGTPRMLGGTDDSRQPEWNASVNFSYQMVFDNGSRFSANLGAKKVGSFVLVNTGAAASERTYEGGYSQVDARVQYEFQVGDEGTVSIALFGKNLTDTEWREQALFLGPGDQQLPSGGPNTGFQGWGAPETWALEVQYNY